MCVFWNLIIAYGPLCLLYEQSIHVHQTGSACMCMKMSVFVPYSSPPSCIIVLGQTQSKLVPWSVHSYSCGWGSKVGIVRRACEISNKMGRPESLNHGTYIRTESSHDMLQSGIRIHTVNQKSDGKCESVSRSCKFSTSIKSWLTLSEHLSQSKRGVTPYTDFIFRYRASAQCTVLPPAPVVMLTSR